MATKVRIELDHDGIQALLKSDAMAEECVRAAERVAAECGEGFAVAEPRDTGQRAAVAVYTDTREARLREAEEGVLFRAVSACRS